MVNGIKLSNKSVKKGANGLICTRTRQATRFWRKLLYNLDLMDTITKTAERFIELNDWYQQPLGQLLSSAITDELASSLSRIFGYHALQLGLPNAKDWIKQSPIQHQIIIDPNHKHPQSGLCADFRELPFINKSLDLVLAPHLFSLNDEPTQVLQEISRVLLPDGYIALIDFNPWSLWGLRQLGHRFSDHLPWSARYHSIWNMQRSLMAEGFTVKHIHQQFYRPPIESMRLNDKFKVLETIGKISWGFPGAVYICLAQKQTMTVTRIRPIWSYRNFVIGKRFIHPTN